MAFVQSAKRATTDVVELAYQYIDSIRNDVAQTTLTNRKHLLLPMLKEIGLNDITKLTIYDIEVYIGSRAAIDKPTTISTRQQVIRSFLQWCQEYKELPLAFHWSLVRRKKVRAPRKVTYSREDIVATMDGCKRAQDRLMIGLLFFTGIRISELLSLKTTDIFGTQIRIRGKGSYDRVVHAPQWLISEVRTFTGMRLVSEGYVFRPLQKHVSHPSDRYISDKEVRKRLQRLFWTVLGKKVDPHQLRHSFAVDWLMRGGDLRTLQIMLGHDSIETTQQYLGLTDIQTGDIYARVFAS